ncbi:multivesicular body subunit 12B-like isoform X2 [Phyllopteryx taeniolatus]|uniref:multivesicular body subunit 12B-like isoform X2 n=1 Tax=Phyllopteryx taeniolatus TaxID=161469 RepID=UPI002AD515CC|nr:multivesicular body subunit 12B-like isoform X2 [Phyllopteryx taeniolatus]
MDTTVGGAKSEETVLRGQRSFSQHMSAVSEKMSTEPLSAVGVLSSHSEAPDDYYVVAQTTDGSDADLWKDGLFKSKVTRYLCFSRKPLVFYSWFIIIGNPSFITELTQGPDVVVDVKLTDMKDALPKGFVAVHETMDTKEPAMRKRRLCVKISPRAAAQTAVFDIQIVAKSTFHLLHYTCMGEINKMGIWYRMGELPHLQSSQGRFGRVQNDVPSDIERTTSGSPECEHQRSGSYTLTDAASQFNGHYDQIPGRDRGGISLQLQHRAKHCCITFL